MIEWLIDNRYFIIGAAALALPLAWADWRMRIQKKKMMQQKSAENKRLEKKTKKKAEGKPKE